MSSSNPNPRPLESLLLPLKPESLQCLYRFTQYEPTKLNRRVPRKRTAAVAICLFVGRLGDLYVLLSTRAGNMRSYASDTALPGGKYEEGDIDEEDTAVSGIRPAILTCGSITFEDPADTLKRREAYEEIGLPRDPDKVRCLCLLDPWLAGNGLIVTPVVLLIISNAINPILNPREVQHLFSMPLTSFLYSHPSKIPGWHFGISTRIAAALPSGVVANIPPPPPIPYAEQGDAGVVGGGEGRYYGYRDIEWSGCTVRMHRFLTGREGRGVRPVYGLTAAILIKAAVVGYEQQPEFAMTAPAQKSMIERMEYEIRHGSGPLRRAVEAEGMAEDWVDHKAKL